MAPCRRASAYSGSAIGPCRNVRIHLLLVDVRLVQELAEVVEPAFDDGLGHLVGQFVETAPCPRGSPCVPRGSAAPDSRPGRGLPALDPCNKGSDATPGR